MKKILICLLILITIFTTGCSITNFTNYERPDYKQDTSNLQIKSYRHANNGIALLVKSDSKIKEINFVPDENDIWRNEPTESLFVYIMSLDNNEYIVLVDENIDKNKKWNVTVYNNNNFWTSVYPDSDIKVSSYNDITDQEWGALISKIEKKEVIDIQKIF